jgi:hypothetical protein
VVVKEMTPKRKAGLVGGPARAAKYTHEQLCEFAKRARATRVKNLALKASAMAAEPNLSGPSKKRASVGPILDSASSVVAGTSAGA